MHTSYCRVVGSRQVLHNGGAPSYMYLQVHCWYHRFKSGADGTDQPARELGAETQIFWSIEPWLLRVPKSFDTHQRFRTEAIFACSPKV